MADGRAAAPPVDLEVDPIADLVREPDPLVRYSALTAAQDAYEELARRIAAERAKAVSEMHAAGLSYAGIAELIGFTRSRAQQLVERAAVSVGREEALEKSMGAQEQLIEYLKRYVSQWPRALPVPFGSRLPPSIADRHTAEQIAKELIADAAFRAIPFGSWLSGPQSVVVAMAVQALVPPLVTRDVDLLVAALDLAVKAERERRTKELAGKILAGIGLVALAVAASKA